MQTLDFAGFVLRMATHIDRAAPKAIATLRDVALTDEERRKYDRRLEEWRSPLSELAAHRQFFMEMMVTRHVDNYLGYLSTLLFAIFVNRPEAMKSSEKVDFEFVLSHASYDSLVRGLADRKVDALSYQSFDRLVSFFGDQFKLTICDPNDQAKLREFVEVRNLSAHNRCIVNRRYIERVPETAYRVGQRRNLGIEDLDNLVPLLFRSVARLDREARGHLRIPGARFAVTKEIGKLYDDSHQRYLRLKS